MNKMSNIRLYNCLTLVLVAWLTLNALLLTAEASFASDDRQTNGMTATLAVVENPTETIRVLESLIRSIVYSAVSPQEVGGLISNQKRGLDLGINRGFSGSQAGKHLMGLSAASFAGGPGK